jgi:hypothetical protein
MTAVAAALALAACATPPPGSALVRSDGLAALGERSAVGGLVVTPLKVVEDSRCPVNARCIWAGRLVLRTQVAGAGWTETRDLELGEPQAVGNDRITLVSARPEPMAGAERGPYLFAFEGGR